jgi:hypothetical protein
MSNAVKVIRALAAQSGVTPDRIFNDRLVDGSRSVKVWGWTHKDYVAALGVLRAAGFRGRVVRNTNSYGWSRATHRIWVD